MTDQNGSTTFAGGLEDDLRKALEASMNTSEQQDDGGEEEVQAQAEETPAEAEPEAEEQSEESGGEAEEEDEAEAQDEGDADEGEGEEEEGPDEDLTKELSHLPQEVRDQFSDLDRKAQRLVLDRYKHLEGRADKKFKEASELRKTADEDLRTARQFDDVLKPYLRHLTEAGVSAPQAVAQVLALRDGLVNDPVEGIAKLADQFMFSRGDVGSPRAQSLIRRLAKKAGVDLEGLAEYDDAQSDTPSSSQAEMIAPLNAEIQQLRQQVQELTTGIRSKETTQGEHIWNQFKADPANEFADELEQDIAHFLNMPEAQAKFLPQEKLKWAYDQAVWANPGTRERMMASKLDAELTKEREAMEAKRKAEAEKARAKVRKVAPDKARKASTQPKTVAPVAKVEDQDLSFEAVMKKAFDEQIGDGPARI